MGSPDGRGGEEHAIVRTREAVRLIFVAEVRDVGEHPRLDGNLDADDNEGGDELRYKEKTHG